MGSQRNQISVGKGHMAGTPGQTVIDQTFFTESFRWFGHKTNWVSWVNKFGQKWKWNSNLANASKCLRAFSVWFDWRRTMIYLSSWFASFNCTKTHFFSNFPWLTQSLRIAHTHTDQLHGISLTAASITRQQQNKYHSVAFYFQNM